MFLVGLDMALPLVGPGESVVTMRTRKGLLPCVGAHVSSEVVGPRKVAMARETLERLGARVDPTMSSEFVGARERLGAVVALMRLLRGLLDGSGGLRGSN